VGSTSGVPGTVREMDHIRNIQGRASDTDTLWWGRGRVCSQVLEEVNEMVNFSIRKPIVGRGSIGLGIDRRRPWRSIFCMRDSRWSGHWHYWRRTVRQSSGGWGKRVAHLNRGSHSDWTCTMSRSSVRMGKLTAGRCFEGRSLMTGGFSGAASCLNGHEQAGHLRIL
jgi:hypothetical protein